MAPPCQLHTLDRTECLRLLGTVPVGRIVFAESALPAIHPVNFTLDGADVIIRTRGGGKFAAAVSGSVVAFEADEIDTATRSGWSVVVLGHACLVRDIDQLVALAGPDSRPWIAGRTDHVIRIHGERITGRRITSPLHGPDPLPAATDPSHRGVTTTQRRCDLPGSSDGADGSPRRRRIFSA